MSLAVKLDAAAIDRILAATRINLPPGLDKARLKDDLNWSLLSFDLFDFSGPIGPSHKKLSGIIKRARRLRKGLDGSDSVLRCFLVQALTDDGKYTQAGADKLESLKADLDKLISGLEAQDKPPPLHRRSIEKLVGIELDGHYQSHLKRPGISRSDGQKEIYGPFVRFVQAVAKEAHIPVPKANSIETYWKKKRSRHGDKAVS
jgi:hypothetical protein